MRTRFSKSSAFHFNGYYVVKKRKGNIYHGNMEERIYRQRGGLSLLRILSALTICIAFIPSLSSAYPTRTPDICGDVQCKAFTENPRNFKFHYKAGSSYNYMYIVNGTIFAEGGPAKESGIHFSVNTTIHFISECDAMLYMKDVELWQSVFPSGQDDIHKHHFTQARTSETFKKSLEQFPLRFSYVDGLVDELCPDESEATWVLNIKRGLLSSFMNSMRRLDLEDKSQEDDVNGRCDVSYRIGQATSSTLTIERIKDLNSCGDKFGIFSSIQGAPYSFGKLQQSMPAVESLSECNQVVDRNLIVEVECVEKHRLKALSSGTSGVLVSINQHLDLISVYASKNTTEEEESQQENNNEDDDGFGLGLDDDEEEEEDDSAKSKNNQKSFVENAGSFLIIYKPDPYISEIISSSPIPVRRRETLHFKHEYHVSSTTTTTNDYNSARNALLKYCQAIKTSAEGNEGIFFEQLVHLLRGVSAADMTHLSRETSSLCNGDRSLFDDVLEAVGSPASVGVIKDRILSGDAPRERISSWINSLTFIPKPDLDLMSAAFPILRVRDNYPNILLSYSALAHSFCRQSPQCSQHQPVQILSRLYEKFFNLTGCVTKQRKNVEQVLAYLKGIGNFGMLTEDIHSALQTCIRSNDRTEIRVAAIEAYRRMSCEKVGERQDDLRNIFANQDEDAEVRIAAFLILMRCPSYSTIRWLKHVMANEEVRQVTSFVSSYMKNLQETSLPSKLNLQGLVTDEKFNDPFHTDFRQFSKNFEASAFYPDGNFGAAVENNLVFSQDSYLPRSTSLNLTVDLFGESVNVLEATVRLESFEHYVESIFGPNGKLRGTGIHNLLSTLKREKRAVPSKRKMRTLALEYDAMRRYYNDPMISFSLKTMGNEVLFRRKVGLEEQVEALSSLNPFLFLEKLSNTKDSNWQKSTMLFDSSYIIPTGVGLPLNLSAQATSIMRFQAESMIDATNFRANPFQLKLKGKLVPSAMITASAGVSLSAFKGHAGMKVRAQLRSSAALEGSFEMEGSKLLDVELGIPKSKIEVLEFKTDVLFMEKGEFHAAGDKSLKLKQTCSPTNGMLYKYLGLKICTSSHFPLPLQSSFSDDDDHHHHNGSDDHPTLMSSMPFLINGPSHFSLAVEKSNPNLLKTRFHYQWNDNETNTDFILRTIRTTESRTNLNEDELGVTYVLDKRNQKFDLDINIPRSKASMNGQFQEAKSTLNFEVKDKASQRSFMGMSLQLNSEQSTVSGEDSERDSLSRKYTGNGEIYYKDMKIELQLGGSQDQKKTQGFCNGVYKRRTGGTESLSLNFLTSEETKRKFGHILLISRETRLSLESTQYADYNSIAVWKSKISEDGYQNDIDFRQGKKYLEESDPTTFRIQGAAHHETNHERTRVKWMLGATQSFQKTDWGVEASFDSHGKSFDSAISFRYAPDKAYGTSVSLRRKPGAMLFLDVAWNVTVPSSVPMRVAFYISEQAARIYQIQYKMDWFGANHLALDVELSDRSRRNKVDTACTLNITTNTIQNFKLGFHYLSEEKETKLQINSEYQDRRNAFEASHKLSGGGKHKFYGSVTTGEVVYIIMTELNFEHGIQCSLRTDLGQSFSNVDVRIKATNQNSLRALQFDYSWDVKETGKRFVFELSLDSSKPNYHRFEGVVMYPGYNYFCEGHYRYDEDDRSRIVMGRLNWKDEEHLHVNAQLVPRISDHEAYDVRLQVATPFELVKNVSVNTGIQFFNERRQCLVNIDGSWGDDQNLQASIESLLEDLENINGESSSKEEEQQENEMMTIKMSPPYKYTFQANVSSTVEGLATLKVNLIHHQFARLNCKTDLDIQMENEKEISVTNHLVLPESFSDLLSTRVELHIKTPFAGFHNVDFQAIVGRKEDKDVMALIGFYVENFQYSIAISGTPRFEEDGALSFEMTTSNPKYDKIFGSFSYVIGDNSRLACQLGWPQVVVGLEAGVESSGWEEFQVYLTFTSPWMPVKNINALAKIDSTQFAEIKLELNEDGINAKSKWVIESWTSFDIRVDGSTPFTGVQTFGCVLKNSWDDPNTYHSQIRGWVDAVQAGYKLEGATSEKEEECGFATVRQAQLELDTVYYPTVRATLNLSQMDIKYNLDMSILLREGPINVIAELEVLDVLRFNEKVFITTPYPSLFELEINLNPAIVLERELYNLGVHSKWRSGSKWDEGGLVIRYGSQEEFAALVTEDLENKAFLECSPTTDTDDDQAVDMQENSEGNDDYDRIGSSGSTTGTTSDIPKSQLFHFFSPLNWANVVKLEYELVSESPDSDVDGESQAQDQDSPDGDIVVDQFPLRNFALVYRASNASFSTTLQNDVSLRSFTAVIDTANLLERRIAYEIDCSLQTGDDDKKLNARAISHHPTQHEYTLMSQWNNQLPQYFTGNVEINTPIEKLEQQTGSLMYAHNVGERSYTIDVELMSITFDKLATNVVLGPKHFSMTLNTPIENYKEIDIRADSKYEENSPVETTITVKNHENEIEIDLETTMMPEGGWPQSVKGTISATFGRATYPRGSLEGRMQKEGDFELTSSANAEWENGKRANVLLEIYLPRRETILLPTFKIMANTTFEGMDGWEMELSSANNENENHYDFRAKSPYPLLSDCVGVIIVEKGNSWLEMKTLKITGDSPGIQMTAESSWLLDKWNNFEVNAKGKYNIKIDKEEKNSNKFLAPLPPSNGFALTIGNKIPTLSILTSVNSKIKLKIQEPDFRAGQQINLHLDRGDYQTLRFESSTVSSNDLTVVNMTAEFEEGLENLVGSMQFKTSGSMDRIYEMDYKWAKNEEAIDAEAELVWGSEASGTVSIQGTFNCSVSESSEGMLHVLIGPPLRKGIFPSQEEVQQQKPENGTTMTTTTTASALAQEEGEEVPTSLANPLDNPMVTIDGSFNKISGRHSARVQIGQDGSKKTPMITDIQLFYKGLNDFDTQIQFSSSIENFTSVGLHIGHTIQPNVFNGSYGGNWNGDEAMLKYYLDYELGENLLLFNVSLYGVIPISTESVPRPQKAGVDVFYKGEPQNMETAFRGEYNGVQLLKTTYKSSTLSSAGLEKENAQLELDNHFWPFGFNHTYQYIYNDGGNTDFGLPTELSHYLDVFSLQDPVKNKFETELKIHSNATGELIALKGKHPSRAVFFITDYNTENRQFQHSASFSWKHESQLGYQLSLMNMTNDDNTDHKLSLSLSYPIRRIELESGYTFDGNTLKWTTDLNLNASRTGDKITSLITLNVVPTNDTNRKTGKMIATLKHPLLAHDIIAAGELTMLGLTASSSSSGRGRIDGIFSMEYSDDPRQRLILNWDAKLDLREIVYGSGIRAGSGSFFILPTYTSFPHWQLETKGKLEHLATNLDVQTLYSTQHSPHELSIIALMDFKNSAKSEKLESKMVFELLKELRKASLQMRDPEGYALFSGEISGQYPVYVANGKCNVTGIHPGPEANVSLDLLKPYFKLYAVHGEDLLDGIFSEGGVIDSRNAYFDISESYNNFRFSDINFYLRLNHSRLITSRLKWRPELYSELKESFIQLCRNATTLAGAEWDRMMEAVKEDGKQSAMDIWEDMMPNIASFLEAMQKDANFSRDAEAMQIFFLDMYNNNELHLRDMHDYVQLAAEELTAKIKQAFERYRRELQNPAKMLEKAVTWIADQLHKLYKYLETGWQNYLMSGGEGLKASLIKLRQLFYLYLNDAIEMAEQLIIQVYQSLSNFGRDVYAHIGYIVDKYQPILMGYIHQAESAVYSVANKILGFFYETRDAVMRSPYYEKLTKLAEDVDEIYKDLSRNDMETNFKKYFGILRNFVMRKISEIKNLNLSLGSAGRVLGGMLQKILEFEVVQDILAAFSSLMESTKYTISYLELDVLIPKFILTMVSKGYSIFYMTAVETASTFEQAKTKFYSEPKKGLLYLEQKLPMPMAAFNETPDFKELPEYKIVTNVQDFFQTRDESDWKRYGRILRNPQDLIPPYEGHAMLVDSQYFFTFDGRSYKHQDNCVHLLTADLVDGNFSVSLQYESKVVGNQNHPYKIIVASGHNTLMIDMEAMGIKDPKRGMQQTVSLPIQMANLQGYRSGNMLVVESPKGLVVSCDTIYGICLFKVSGWYSRKVAGVLGSLDLEPFNDLQLVNGERADNISQVFKSWDVSDDSSGNCMEQETVVDEEVITSPAPTDDPQLTAITSTCNRIFTSKQSSLQPCFSQVKVDPFLEMCLAQVNNPGDETTPPYCVAAISYLYQCQNFGVQVKVPSACVKCLKGDEILTDGDIKVISSPPPGSPSTLTSDVVFIIEAKDCNRGLRTKRKMDTIVTALEEEFTKKGFQNNRYAAVIYGGDSIFDSPRPIVQNNQVFTTAENISGYLPSFSIGNGNNDTFGAIWYSLQNLEFRPGASKTFILFPCSNCNPWEMTVDYPSVHYAMLEQDAKLHVLMNKDFLFDSKNLAKKFFGYDAKLGYTKSDGNKNRLKGDQKIRHEVFLPRKNLGYCAPLALETNGTIFSAKKLQNRREKVVALFTTVFSRRVVAKASPSECQTCYCLPNERTGLGKLECFVCSYPRYKPLPDDYDDNSPSPSDSLEIQGAHQTEIEEDATDVYDEEGVDDEDD